MPKPNVGFEPIVVKTHPFQQTSQPEEFNLGTVLCAIFIGMSFILVPVSLAVDMVYDREASIEETEQNRQTVHTCVGMYVCVYIYIYICIHTHTHTQSCVT